MRQVKQTIVVEQVANLRRVGNPLGVCAKQTSAIGNRAQDSILPH